MPLWTQLGNPTREDASRPGGRPIGAWREGKISMKTGLISKIQPPFGI